MSPLIKAIRGSRPCSGVSFKNVAAIVQLSLACRLCKNDSSYNDTNLRNTPFETNEYELEVEWKQNKLFAFNNLDKAWHYYKSGNAPRIIIQSFFVDLDKVLPGKEEWDHLIDIDPLTYD